MMKKGSVIRFNSIPVKTDECNIKARLGHRKGFTEFDTDEQGFLDNVIATAKMLCTLKGALIRLDIIEKGNSFIKAEGGYTFRSADLALFLEKSDEILLIAATAGKSITDRISKEIRNGDGALAASLDAAASQIADDALDWIMEYVNIRLKKEDGILTRRRYSPGYGDLDLSNQKLVYEIMGLEKLGIEITDAYILIPEKSVIAITGIERTVNNG